MNSGTPCTTCDESHSDCQLTNDLSQEWFMVHEGKKINYNGDFDAKFTMYAPDTAKTGESLVCNTKKSLFCGIIVLSTDWATRGITALGLKWCNMFDWNVKIEERVWVNQPASFASDGSSGNIPQGGMEFG